MTQIQLDEILNKKVKIIFGEHDPRTPKIGYFVKIKDASHLSSRGMCRFVFDKWYENYEKTQMSAYTRIFVLSDIKYVIQSVDGKEKIIS